MATIKKLDLDDCARTSVFRRLETILRSDPTLIRVVGTSWKTYSGLPTDATPFAGLPRRQAVEMISQGSAFLAE